MICVDWRKDAFRHRFFTLPKARPTQSTTGTRLKFRFFGGWDFPKGLQQQKDWIATEVPTPRWSTLLAIENGLPLPKDVPATEQQRGWSSPIWYQSSKSPGIDGKTSR